MGDTASDWGRERERESVCVLVSMCNHKIKYSCYTILLGMINYIHTIIIITPLLVLWLRGTVTGCPVWAVGNRRT